LRTPRTTTEIAFRDRPHFLHGLLLAITGACLLLMVAGIHGWIRELLALVVLTFLPGAAVLTYLPRLNPLMHVGIAAAFSLMIVTVLSDLLVALSFFHTQLLIWTIFPLSALLLYWREFVTALPPRRPRPMRQTFAAARDRYRNRLKSNWQVAKSRANRWALGSLVVGVVLALIAAKNVDVSRIGDYGLIAVLPWGWPLGFALVLIATALYAAKREANPWVMASLVSGVIVIIYATAPLVYQAPHLPWVYKHVGVVNLLLDQRHALKDVDIYNRWPAFFALGGVFTRFSGAPGPVTFVGWAEIYFISLQTALVGSMMWNETKRVGPTGLAALLFVLINWIGQAYFSPQALAFTLMLALLTIAFSQLYDVGNGLGRLISWLTSFVVRRKQQWDAERPDPEWSRRSAIIGVLALDVGVAVTHQLTPYVLLIQLGILTVCGFIKPRWLLLGCVAITVGYLLPNLSWVNDHYGLFSSLDPFNNAKVADTTKYTCSAACELVGRISTLASAFSWLVGIAAIVVLARRKPTFRLPLYGLAMFGAFAMIFGQSYGGEAALRVVMFSSPFAAVLIAAAISTFGDQLRSFLAVSMTIVLAISFIYAYFGNEEYYYVNRDSIRASEYLYAHAPQGSVILFTAENFPGLLAGNYSDFQISGYTGSSGIFDDTRLHGLPLGPDEVQYLIEDIEVTDKNGFIVFSDQQDNYALKKGMAPPGQLERLRNEMVASGRFELWHRDGGTSIYRLIPQAGTTAPG
jgi:hypothetical protein